MSRLFITGDVHLNEWDEFSTILPNGINSRLQVGLDAIEQVAEGARGEVLIVAGDLFHTREELSVQVLFRAGEAIRKASEICKEVILLVGNHDQHLKDGRVHSLGTFESSNVKVIDVPGIHDVPGFGDVLFMPYMNDYEEFGSRYKELTSKLAGGGRNISILHADIVGFEMNSGFLSTRGITPQFALDAGGNGLIDLCISGHYHKPQKFGDLDVYYVGSPYQMDRSEAGHEKRYLVVSDDLSVESIPIKGLPIFRKVPLREASEMKKTNDFVDVSCAEEDVRDGWSKELPSNFNIVLEKSASNESDFTSVEVSDAVQRWLRERDKGSLIERAMERLSRNS